MSNARSPKPARAEGAALSPEQRLAIRPSMPQPELSVEAQLIADVDGVLFVHKPAAWPTSGRDLHDPNCLQYRLMQHYGRMVWAVHQLDADTSGLNVFVRRKELVPRWQNELHFPKARKEYLAIVHGRLERSLKLAEPIGRRADGSWGVAVEGKPALTLVYPVAVGEAHTLVRVQLRSGRTHQIRVHMSHAGYPLVGEFWYNDAPCTLAPRHMLHAWRTHFSRWEGASVAVVEPPQDFVACAAGLGVAVPATIDDTSTALSGLIARE